MSECVRNCTPAALKEIDKINVEYSAYLRDKKKRLYVTANVLSKLSGIGVSVVSQILSNRQNFSVGQYVVLNTALDTIASYRSSCPNRRKIIRSITELGY